MAKSLSIVEKAVALALSIDTPTTLSKIAASCSRLMPSILPSFTATRPLPASAFTRSGWVNPRPCHRQLGSGRAAHGNLIGADGLESGPELEPLQRNRAAEGRRRVPSPSVPCVRRNPPKS